MAAHEHRHSILVGNAPITMMAGKRLLIRRACRCGDTVTVGTYRYDPVEAPA